MLELILSVAVYTKFLNVFYCDENVPSTFHQRAQVDYSGKYPAGRVPSSSYTIVSSRHCGTYSFVIDWKGRNRLLTTVVVYRENNNENKKKSQQARTRYTLVPCAPTSQLGVLEVGLRRERSCWSCVLANRLNTANNIVS